MARSDLDEHYERMADKYDAYLSYSQDFVESLASAIVDELGLRPDDRFVDLGGGTGLYTSAVLDLVDLEHPPVLVDPIAAMLEQAPAGLRAERLHMGALEFAERPGRYDKVLVKESIHHVEDRPRLFRGLFERLTPGGAVLLVHIPPEIDYPLFDAALERSRHWHANPEELVRDLAGAGFEVTRDRFEYHHEIPKRHYFRLVQDRYMSLLSSFEDDELAAGLAEMEQRYAEVDELRFVDRFDTITGRKPSSPPSSALP